MPETPVAAPASRTVVHHVRVEFGDCDPARIVWFPNYFRWIDAASQHFFTTCGVPPWHELEKTTGILGTPLVDTQARFVKTASYGDLLQIEARVSAWRRSSFTQSYRVLRAQPDGTGAPDLIMECEEVRIFAAHRDGDDRAIRAVPIPESIRALCT
ncbi:thioesterase family protein [Pseudorhodoferax sp. Leaf267]|uniref:acyl-CoA thioesterase n=1 Tax=Pseudorhodoferax sp. Leaf267 TaxID=1736316 RepID=UPI0006F8A17B|nr:acyl-CoA thioesterase [Pseudorhodoferax sp. Leaf267]KQP22477.1 4-hydroxybenzoyl-CoA thioesterase [Pseudorhodoferax sp. Leaf267]